MCGHVGLAGKIGAKQEKVFEQLLIVDAVRGIDSTGAAIIARRGGDVKVPKQVGNPYELLMSREYDKAIRGLHKVIIGHNRWATQGKVTKKNAHPFEFDTLVGAHNGTLDNKYALQDHSFYEVDSENLFDNIESLGVRETIGKLRGAWALVWWDKTTHRLNFLRNKERPLWLRTDEEGNLYWSSERWMIDSILARNDIKCKEEAWSLKEDTWLSVSVNDEGIISDTHVEHEVKGAPPFVAVTTTNVTTVKKQETNDGPKNNSKLTTTSSDSIDKQYLVANRVEFEYIAEAMDKDGNRFCVLFDQQHPDYTVRLYLHHCHNVQTLPGGSIVYADVQSVVQRDGGVFYKVSPWSVKIGTLMNIEDDDIEDVEYEMFKDHTGSYMDRKSFLSQYPTCDCCDCNTVPEQANRFTVNNELLCPACQHDMAGYISLK